jgi:hypothetical protein
MAKVFYTRKDLVSFGNYVIQLEKQKELQHIHIGITHANVENWLEESKVVTKAIADEE